MEQRVAEGRWGEGQQRAEMHVRSAEGEEQQREGKKKQGNARRAEKRRREQQQSDEGGEGRGREPREDEAMGDK